MLTEIPLGFIRTPDASELLLRLPIVLFALTVHEFAHAYSAYRLGDDTARLLGRLTLNPLAHLELFGTICIMFGPIGWAKPVPVNPLNFRNRGRDDIIVSIAGPASNLVLAFVFALLVRVYVGIEWQNADTAAAVRGFLFLGVIVNVGLACFNMLPVFPLDGHHVMREMLPPEQRDQYMSHARYGPFIILGLVLFGREFLWGLIKPVALFFLNTIGGAQVSFS